jgi:hypothetical protein
VKMGSARDISEGKAPSATASSTKMIPDRVKVGRCGFSLFFT